jgi:hypothetical protein
MDITTLFFTIIGLIGSISVAIFSAIVTHSLQLENDKLKNKLRAIENERNILISNLTPIKFEIIRLLYMKAIDLKRNSMRYMYSGDIGIAEVWNAKREFTDFYEKNEIIFTESITEIIKSFIDVLYDLDLSNNMNQLRIKNGISESDQEMYLNGIRKILDNDLPKVILELKKAFRKDIGVMID